MPTLQPLDMPLQFGIFLPPMHKTGVNPTLAIQRDLELVTLLDGLILAHNAIDWCYVRGAFKAKQLRIASPPTVWCGELPLLCCHFNFHARKKAHLVGMPSCI